MREILDHKVYELLKYKYNQNYLDYVILSVENEYKDVETHQNAVIKAIKIISDRMKVDNEEAFEISLDTEKMKATSISMEDFLQLPSDEYYDSKKNSSSRTYTIPTPLTYWFAFLEPPHGNRYLKSDFIEFNDFLFPNKMSCEVYRWNDTFSDYFDVGKEWWGTGLWTVYDKNTGIIVVIGASLTD